MIISLVDISFVSLLIMFIWIYLGSFGIPGILLLAISAGVLAKSLPQLLLVMLVIFIALILGDISVYEISRKLSVPVLNKLRKFSFFRNNENSVRKLLGKYEFLLVFFTRFAVVALCVVTSYISGLEKLNRKKYYTAVVSGEALYAVIYPSIGFLIGITLSSLLSAINEFLIVLVLISVIVYYAGKFLAKRM